MREITKNRINALKKAGLDLSHSEETKTKLSDIAKKRVLSEETKVKLRKIAKNRVLSEERKAMVSKMHLSRSKESKERDKERLLKFSQAMSRPVRVINVLTAETTIYSSISQAAKGIGVYPNAVRSALQNERLIKNTYKPSYENKPE
jgi:hypothetical protein